MIFVTTGTTLFPFRRMEKLVLEISKLYPKSELIFQGANIIESSFPKTINVESFLEPDSFNNYLKEAEIIVAHAGFATVMQAIKYAKTKPFIMPRLKRFGEHVNDHQLFFAKFMEEKSLVVVVNKPDQVQDTLKQNKLESAIVKKYLDNVSSRRKKLVKFLNEVEFD